MREAADCLLDGRASPRKTASDHLLSHSNSFGFEMEIGTAGCRAYDRNFIVGEETAWKNRCYAPQTLLNSGNDCIRQ